MSSPVSYLLDKVDLLFDLADEIERLFHRYNTGNCIAASFRMTPSGVVLLNPQDNYSIECRELDTTLTEKIGALRVIYSHVHGREPREKTNFRTKISDAYASCQDTERGVRLVRICELICDRHHIVHPKENLRLPWTGGNTCYVDVVLMALAGHPNMAFDSMLDSGEEVFSRRLMHRYQKFGPDFQKWANDSHHFLVNIRSELRKRQKTSETSTDLAVIRDRFISTMANFDPWVFRSGLTGSPGEVLTALPWAESTLDRNSDPKDSSPVFCIHETTSPFLQKSYSSLLSDVKSAQALVFVNDSLSKRVLTMTPSVSVAIPTCSPKQLLYVHAVVCSTNRNGDDGHYVAFLKHGSTWYFYDDLQPTLFPKVGRFSDLIAHPLMLHACVYFYQA
jgi:hypothetical protein